MITHESYLSALKNTAAKVKFNDFLQNKDNPFPDCRVHDYMILGPFVLETDGAFETEYLYERHKVLDCDYLKSSGGELNVKPFNGQALKNDYWGEEYLRWEYRHVGNDLGFRHDNESAASAVFVTEQRNCVNYAAFYVECEEESDAIICYETSGNNLYLNGELIDSKPYGRVKGMDSLGNQCAVTFQKGLNLVMFKVRVGYIADGLDFKIQRCFIYPVSVRSGNVGICQPYPTISYFGTKEEPRQIFPTFAGAFGAFGGGSLKYKIKNWSEELSIDPIESGKCSILRMSVPTIDEEENLAFELELKDKAAKAKKGKYFINTIPYHGFEGTEHIFSDFHFDTTYHQEQRTYALGAIHITKSMIDELIRDPHFKAILSEVDYLHPYYSIFPDHREALKKVFTEGRAESDCFYNQPNDLTSSGEGFVRNLVYGQLYHRDVLGRICYVYSPGDVFGHPNQMSQICRKGGCTSCNWGKTVIGLDSLLHHVSPDGSDLIHLKGMSAIDAGRLGLSHFTELPSNQGAPDPYPHQGDTSWMKDTLNNTSFSYFSELMDAFIEDEKKQIEETGYTKIEYSARDLTPHHAGVLLTRTDYKQANRLAENLLITAEKFSAIAAYYGADYPEKALDKAWRQLLCAQHHDSITGTNNEISYVDLMIEYREAVELAADVVNKAIAFLASGVKLEEKELPIFVFNPHTWQRKDKCRILLPEYAAQGYALFDEKGNEYDFTVTGKKKKSLKSVFIPDVPAMGYAVYYLKKSKKAAFVNKLDCTAIENEFFKLTVDKKLGGGIVSIFDKNANKEIVNLASDGPANRVVILKEVSDRCETQHEYYTTGMKMFSSDYKARIQCEKTNTYEKLTIYVRMDIVARIKQEITLYKGIRRIDMTTAIEDYQDKDDLFTLTFPVNVSGGRPVYEDRFAPHICGTGAHKLSFQTHQYYMYSHCQVAPTVNWIDLGPTVKMKLDENNDVNIGMTAIIRANTTALSQSCDALLKALALKAIPVTPYDDVEQHRGGKLIHFNEDLRNTDTRFVLCVEGTENAYEKQLLDNVITAKANEFNKNLKENGSAILFTRDKDNMLEKDIDVVLIKAKDIETLNEVIAGIANQLESGKSVCLCGCTVCAEVSNTENYGVSILNKGTIACSVEPDNLMNMMLFHTAEVYGNHGKVTGGKELIPEQKTHQFDYALYPHEGDYRDALVIQKGMEFNDDIIAATDVPKAKNHPLPQTKSFLRSSDNFIVTSFKLGGYPLAAMKSDMGSVDKRGFALRGFEPNGIKAKATFDFGMDIGKVKATDLLEENAKNVTSKANTFTSDIPSHSIETFVIGAKASEKAIGSAKLGVEREIVEPTYIRTWEHDLGTMPIGYFSVVASLGKDVKRIDDKTFEFKVSVANNHPDKAIKGTLEVIVPKGFKADKKTLEYSVAKNGLQVLPLTVTKPKADSDGIVRLICKYDGQVFEDIYEFGYFNPETTLRIEDGRIVATVINHTSSRLIGELSIATPYETWDCDGFNTAARGNVYPRTMKIDIDAGEVKEYEFALELYAEDDLFDAFWAVTKLMVNGRIHFGYAHKKGQRHNWWTGEFRNIVQKDNGSLKKMFELLNP